MKKYFLLGAAAVLSAFTASSQCTTGGTLFGGVTAPCSVSPPVAVNIAAFEVWRGDLYEIDAVKIGGSYTVDICQSALPGGGGSAWNASLTIVAPSGAVMASGLDGGSICELSFTATEAGTHSIFINEVGECPGVSQSVDNGSPRVTYTGGATCDPPVTVCEAGTLDATATAASICPGDATDFTVTGISVPNTPTQGGVGVEFTPVLGSGTGGNEVGFVITGYDANDFGPYVFDNDVNGILSANLLPPLAGQWILEPYIYPNDADVFTKCDSTSSVTVDFLTFSDPGCQPVTACDAGVLDQAGIDNELCPQETTDYSITGFTLPNSPVPGEYVLEFIPVPGSGSGGPFGTEPDPSFVLTLNAPAGSENQDVTIVLDNELLNSTGIAQPALEGEWNIRGAVFAGSVTPCDSVPAVVINFKTSAEFPCGGPAPCENPFPAVDDASLAVVQNPNGSITFSWDPILGQIGCQVNAVVGPPGPSVNQIVGGAGASSFTANAGQLTPFTTYSFRVRCGCQQSPTIAGPFSSFVSIFYGVTPLIVNNTDLAKASKNHFASTGGKQLALSGSIEDAIPTNVNSNGGMTGVISKAATKTSTSFSVFPNPSTGAVSLDYEASVEGLINVRVFDVVGKAVADYSMSVNEGSNFLNLDLSSFEKGLYVIEVLEGQRSSTSKVVLK